MKWTLRSDPSTARQGSSAGSVVANFASPNRVSWLSWRHRQAEKESRDRSSRNRLTVEREITDAVVVEIEGNLTLVHERQICWGINDLSLRSGRHCQQPQTRCGRSQRISVEPPIARFGKAGGVAGSARLEHKITPGGRQTLCSRDSGPSMALVSRAQPAENSHITGSPAMDNILLWNRPRRTDADPNSCSLAALP